MSMLDGLSNIIKLIISLIGLSASIYGVINLMYFLSVPNYSHNVSNESGASLPSWSLIINMLLLSSFIFQHSAFATLDVKNWCNKHGLQPIYRSIYVTTTALALQLVTSYWQDIPEVIFWKYNLNYKPFWWLYVVTHALSWIIIYVGSICLDINELLGMKQVYYNVMNLPDPNLNKSESLKRLTTHMRHPSFLTFLIIFWTVPIMSVDRFLLASIVSLYMYIAWNTDEDDYSYYQTQYLRKYHELERLSS